MKLEKTIRRLARSTEDSSDLRRVARDIGHELSRKRLPMLRELRSKIAGMQGDEASDFVHGYRAALGDLLAACEADIEPQLELEAARTLLSRKKHATVTVRELASRPATPTELAATLPISLSVVSRLLASLRSAGIVEWSNAEEGTDGRSRPQQLTSLGMALTRGTGIEPNMKTVLRVAVKAFGALTTERRVWLPDLLTEADSVGGDALLGCLQIELEKAGLVIGAQDSLLAPEMSIQNYVAAELDRALKTVNTDDWELPKFLQDICGKLDPTRTTLLVRSAKPSDSWDQLFESWNEHPTSTSPCTPFANVRVINQTDRRLDDIPNPGESTNDIALVYESVPTLMRDTHNWPHFAQFTDQATHRFCFVSEDKRAPIGWTPIMVNP